MPDALIPEDYDPQDLQYAEAAWGQAPQGAKPTPSEALIDRLKLSFPKVSYHWLFWGLIVPGAAATLFAGMMASRPQVATLDTPASSQFQTAELEQAIAIVVGRPLTTPEGKEYFVSDPTQKLLAAQQVLRYQESQLIAKKATYMALDMARGAATPKHMCYQKPQVQCIDLLRRANDQRRQEAANKQDLDGLLLTAQIDRALDRVATGDLSPDRYQHDLHLMAIAKYRAAISEQEAISANGQAAQILRDVQQEGLTK